MELGGCRGGFFLECCSVRHEDGVNIVVVGAARLFDLGVGEDGIINDLINIDYCLIFLDFLAMTNNLSDFVVKYVGSRSMTDDMASRRSLSPEFIVSGVILRMGTMSV